MSTKTTIHAIRQALSFARISTFETSVKSVDDADSRALALYAWNARISAALLAPLHVCEVVIRNAVSDAVEKVYGPRWPWQIGFEQSLPSPRTGYNPQRDLHNARSHAPTTRQGHPRVESYLLANDVHESARSTVMDTLPSPDSTNPRSGQTCQSTPSGDLRRSRADTVSPKSYSAPRANLR